jgi:hypothetical protein
VDVLTPELSVTAVDSEVMSATPPPDATFTPSPTELSALPTFTSTPLPQHDGIYPIRFASNGTYIDVVDSLLAGASKTYSINAMKGQVMSISILLSANSSWTVVPMKIVGADGTVLCPPEENDRCYFWRGVLPATQDYFVTLTPEVDVWDFTMRVAIDPPGTTSQSFQYLSNNQEVSFSYTDDFAQVLFPEMYIYKFTPELALQFIDTESLVDTNLSEAYFMFGASDDAGIVESCTQPVSLGGQEIIIGEVNIGGTPFLRSEAVGLGAGNAYEQTYYRTVYGGYCYEVTFFVHSTNIGNYPPESGVREFDRDALIQKFEAILSTLFIK